MELCGCGAVAAVLPCRHLGSDRCRMATTAYGWVVGGDAGWHPRVEMGKGDVGSLVLLGSNIKPRLVKTLPR